LTDLVSNKSYSVEGKSGKKYNLRTTV